MFVFYFYRHLYLQTCGHIYRYRLPLEDKRGLSFGELIRPFCIMLLYQYLLHYGLLLHIMSQYLCLFSLILQGLHKEGECRQLEFWAGKGANIRDLFCTTPPETPRKLFLEIIKNTEWKKYVRGASTCPRGWGRTLPPERAPCLVGPLC